MRGSDAKSGSLFSYVDLDQRVPAKHPLRVIKALADAPDGTGPAISTAKSAPTTRTRVRQTRMRSCSAKAKANPRSSTSWAMR
jgi:hypothetical protein